MKQQLLLIFMFIGLAGIAQAQPDFTLPSLRNTYQSTYINPAFKSKYKVSIGIPVLSSLYINNTRSGFTLKDVTESIDDSSYLDLNKFCEKIDGDAIAVTTISNADIFHISFPVGKFQMSFNSTLKVQTTQAISKDFIGFVVNGNAHFKGQTADFKAFDISSINYVENGFSLARKFGKLSVGVRAKYLIGLAIVQTKNIKMGVTTPASAYDPLVIHTGGTINTAGVPLLTDSVTGEEKDASQKEFSVSDLTKMRNNGIGFDAGVTYKILPKLMIHASVVDFGTAIKWKGSPYNYTLENADVKYDGFTQEHLNSGDAQNAYTDSLVKLLSKHTVTTNSFTTTLNARYFAGADYQLTKSDVVGFLFQGQKVVGKFIPAYTFSYTHSFGNIWDLTSNYSIYNKSFVNIGVGTAIKLGPVQLYLISDDILVYMKPETGNTVYLRFGLNLTMGKVDGK